MNYKVFTSFFYTYLVVFLLQLNSADAQAREQSWESVLPQITELCVERLFKDDTIASALCVENEKKAFSLFNSATGNLPPEIAQKYKEECASKPGRVSFQMKMLCFDLKASRHSQGTAK